MLRATRIRKLDTHFLVCLITCFCTRLSTSHFAHVKQFFVHMCTLTCTSPCTFYKDRNIEGKLKVYSTHHLDFALHSRTNLGIKTIFYIERNNKQVSYLVNPVFVGLRQRGCCLNIVGMKVLGRSPRRLQILA